MRNLRRIDNILLTVRDTKSELDKFEYVNRSLVTLHSALVTEAERRLNNLQTLEGEQYDNEKETLVKVCREMMDVANKMICELSSVNKSVQGLLLRRR